MFRYVIFFPTVALRTNPQFKTIPEDLIEDVIKRWLRYASDRNGGRIKRMKQNV